jgi:phosphoglycolate phosphatase
MRLLELYGQQLAIGTQLFDGCREVLDTLAARQLPWGIVTNKPARFTQPLTQQLGLHHRAACIISGDEIKHTKPHPEPLLVASKQMTVSPSDCIYLGDDIRDVKASLAAGMEPIIAKYGYLGDDHPPESWGAKYIIDHPQDLLAYL